MFTKKVLNQLARARVRYEKQVERILQTAGEQIPEHKTMSGLPLKMLYTPEDTAAIDYINDTGWPGEFPYTRGLHPTGYRTREWTRRQVIGLGTAEETNERLHYLIEQGQTGFSVCGMGYFHYESIDERSLGHLGRGGVWIDTLADMETLLESIDMEKISINQIGSSIPIFAMILAVAKKRQIDISRLQGTIQNMIFPGGEGPQRKGNGSIDIVEFCTKFLPKWNHTSISVRNIRDQGITAPQEIAFGLYAGISTVKAVTARKIPVDDFASRISFFLSAENEFLEEVAKYRAMRRMWARLMRERFQAKDPKSWMLRYHVQTSAINLTAQQPLNNIIRATIHALAAVMGGAQSMSVNSFDEALAIPTKASATVSLRTQQIIMHESGVANVIDPMGGSYCVETLTNQLEQEAEKILKTLEDMDDVAAEQWMKRKTEEEAYKRQQAIDRGERVMVGVNRYQMPQEEDQQLQPAEIFEYDPRWRDKQIRRLEKTKKERNPEEVQKARMLLTETYRSRENIIPAMIEAVKAYLSIGEICKIREEALGETTSSSELYFGK